MPEQIFFLQSSALYNFYIWISLSWLCHSFTVFYFLWTQRSGLSFKIVLLKLYHFTLKAQYHFLSIHPKRELNSFIHTSQCECLLYARSQAGVWMDICKRTLGLTDQQRIVSKQGTIKQRGSFGSCLWTQVTQLMFSILDVILGKLLKFSNPNSSSSGKCRPWKSWP